MPYFRNHAAMGTAQQEPWVFGQPYELINRMTIQLRYRLLPSLYSVVAQSAEYGWPVIRPLFMAEPANPAIRGIDDCYLLGDGLLVAPIVEKGATSRNVYLPAGSDWYDYWTNERFEGGQEIEATASLERLPLYVRAGLVLPLWPEMQFVGEQSIEKLRLRYYPGSSETVLYEDRGEGPEHQQGEYRWVYITTLEDEDFLRINRRIAGRFVPTYQSLGIEVVGLADEPADVIVDRRGAPMWFYDDGLLEITTDAFDTIEIGLKSSASDRTLLSRPW
jgi:alpha-glucosidase